VPRVSQWFIRTAMMYFLVALVLGAAMQTTLAGRLPLFRALWLTYIHLLVVGWLTQLIFGVAYWMFPRYSAERPRGSERLGWATFALLNLGLLLRVIAEPWHALAGQGAALLVGSALLQLLAGWIFVVNTWPRIRER
jgi:heme/copper-type cytochrome/quinol oxidase subunit 1